MLTENSGITTNSSEKLFQNEQNGTKVDTDFKQEKRNNMTAYPAKPSEPSANFDRNNDGGCQGRTSTN
jgi:hypothetical protein